MDYLITDEYPMDTVPTWSTVRPSADLHRNEAKATNSQIAKRCED